MPTLASIGRWNNRKTLKMIGCVQVAEIRIHRLIKEVKRQDKMRDDDIRQKLDVKSILAVNEEVLLK